METKIVETKLTQRCALFVAVVVALFAMKEAADIIAPVLLALFIAIILSGAIGRLQKIGVPFALAVVLITILLLIVAFSITTVLSSSVLTFRANLAEYQANLSAKAASLGSLFALVGLNPTAVGSLIRTADPSSMVQITVDFLQRVSNLFGSSFTLLLTVIFMLIDASRLSRIVGAQSTSPLAKQIDSMLQQVRHYLSIKGITSCITGAAVTLLLLLFDVDLPFLWGVVALLLNFIPNIGSILAAIPAILLAWVQFDLLVVLWIIAGFFVINIIVGSILEPKMMNNMLGVSLLTVFLSLIFWGWVFGLIGMFLSVPLTITMKIYLEQYQHTRFFASLL